MSKKKVLGYCLQIPMWILLVGSFFSGIYAASKNIQGITGAVPTIIFFIMVMYFSGRGLVAKANKNKWTLEIKELHKSIKRLADEDEDEKN
jgi:hypothetical protein